MKCVTCKVDLDQHGTRDFETCLQKASVPRSVISVQARKAVADALELAKARRILLTADWAVTPAEKQLARKVIDRLTHNAAKKGFKGQ
jgi:hypothetical protein